MPVGRDPLDDTMKSLSKSTQLSRIHTNQCVHASVVMSLDEKGFKARHTSRQLEAITGADPGHVVGESANPSKGGANLIYFIFFLKNIMKLNKFWSVGGGAHRKRPNLDPPLLKSDHMQVNVQTENAEKFLITFSLSVYEETIDDL